MNNVRNHTKTQYSKFPNTIIEGTLKTEEIERAVALYLEGLAKLAFPANLHTSSRVPKNIDDLKPLFTRRIKYSTNHIKDIISEINRRAVDWHSEVFSRLLQKDRALWQTKTGKMVEFGVLCCVDKGIPSEAVVGVDGAIGRLLAGDIEVAFIPTKKKFVAVASTLTKRLVHMGRQGIDCIVEPLIEHTACGRRGQMLANEEGIADIPSINYVISHAEALTSELPGKLEHNISKIQQIQSLWLSLDRSTSGVKAKDGGTYIGIILKIAQRQAFKSLPFIHLFSPVEIYDKYTGDMMAGIDRLEVLTDKDVIKNGGYTKEVLQKLVTSQKIFGVSFYMKDLKTILKKVSSFAPGSSTYADLQTRWLTTQEKLISITESLWKIYQSTAKDSFFIKKMVKTYLSFAFDDQNSVGASFKLAPAWASYRESAKMRLIHHLFHVIAYAYLFDTFEKGNPPGIHIEDHLAFGDHAGGAKSHLALGQGDLDRPSATEIFTGYSVLLHSIPGKTGIPIPVMIKLDTERLKEYPMTTEETSIAQEDFKEFLKLWPYFMVGDMLPVIAIRGKQNGGVSRLGLSVVLSFGDMVDLLEQPRSPLPPFVPANNSQGEVVLVPGEDVLICGIEAGKDLGKFRHDMAHVADRYSKPAVQESFDRLYRQV